jgi:protein TonB
MKSALFLSFSFHLAVGMLWSLIVKINQVQFVPRQVYSVDIVTAAELPKPPKPAPKQEEPPAPKPEPVKKVEEEVAPPLKPKPKPKPKPVEKVEKTMPTTDEDKAEPPPDVADDTPVVTGDISLDGEDFPFAYYLANMRRKIAVFWQPGGGEEKFCVVYFRIGRNGSIGSPTIETSSGNLVFDRAALRAVHRANPLPALPPAYAEDELGVHFSFSYIRE